MKSLFYFCIVLSSIFIFSSCSKDKSQIEDSNLIPIIENGVTIDYVDYNSIRILTDNEIAELINKGYLAETQSRGHSCAWSDGFGGELACDGGECKIVTSSSSSGGAWVGLMCFKNNAPSHTGLYRPL